MHAGETMHCEPCYNSYFIELENLNLNKAYSTEYSFAHCTIVVNKIITSSGDPY